MKFIANAKNVDLGLKIVVLADIIPAELTTAKSYKDGQVSDEERLFDGHPAYTIRGLAVMEDKRQLRNVSVKVLNKPKDVIPFGSSIVLAGEVSLTPYVGNDGRVGLSILADSIEIAQ